MLFHHPAPSRKPSVLFHHPPPWRKSSVLMTCSAVAENRSW